MPREIFADEIERFLESLDGVSSVRVLTGPNGDVSSVYVTSAGALDSRRLRSGVIAALQSRFGIPIDDWRVRVTQLRAGAQSTEIPHFRVVRVEETATATDLSVTVRLQWTCGPEERSAAGQAQARFGAGRGAAGPGEGRVSGPATRARTLAAATVAAARTALDVPHSDLTLDRVGVVTFLDRPVMLVALSAPIAGAPRTFVGAAFDAAAESDGAAEPAVAAALDAVTRWLLRAAFTVDASQSPHRRDRLDAMRRFVLDSAAGALPGPLRPARLAEAAGAVGAPSGTAPRATPVRELPPYRGAAGNGRSVAAPVEAKHAADPTPGGGTAMGLHQETPDLGSGMRAAPPAGVEDDFYRSLIVECTPVHLRCRDGYEVARAIVRDVGTHALLVETADGLELFFKHAIISIRILPKPAAQA